MVNTRSLYFIRCIYIGLTCCNVLIGSDIPITRDSAIKNELIIPDKEMEEAVTLLRFELDKELIEKLRIDFEKDGEQGLLEQHNSLGLKIRNILRKKGFNWGSRNLDDNWIPIIIEVVNPQFNKSIAELRLGLRDKNAAIRFWSANRLNFILEQSKKAMGDLIASLADSNASVRREAAMALGNFEANSEEIIKALVKASEDRNLNARCCVIEALGQLSVVDKRVVGAIGSALRDENRLIRLSAISAIAGMERNSAAYLPLLEPLQADKFEEIRLAAKRTINAIREAAQDFEIDYQSPSTSVPVPPSTPVKGTETTKSDDSKTGGEAQR